MRSHPSLSLSWSMKSHWSRIHLFFMPLSQPSSVLIIHPHQPVSSWELYLRGKVSRKSLVAARYCSTNEQLNISDWLCRTFFCFINMRNSWISVIPLFCGIPLSTISPALFPTKYKYEMLLIHFPFALICLSCSASDYAGDGNDETASQKENEREKNMYQLT